MCNQKFAALTKDQEEIAITAITHLNAMRQLCIMQKEAREGMLKAMQACSSATNSLCTTQDQVDATHLTSKIQGAKASMARRLEKERIWHFMEFMKHLEAIHPEAYAKKQEAPGRDHATLLEMIETYLPGFSGILLTVEEAEEWLSEARQ